MPTASDTVAQARHKDFTIEGLGHFVLHRPTNGDKVTMGIRIAQYSGGVQLLDWESSLIVRCKTILLTVADDKPAGFDEVAYDAFEETEPLMTFWAAYEDWLAAFRRAGAHTAS